MEKLRDCALTCADPNDCLPSLVCKFPSVGLRYAFLTIKQTMKGKKKSTNQKKKSIKSGSRVESKSKDYYSPEELGLKKISHCPEVFACCGRDVVLLIDIDTKDLVGAWVLLFDFV